MLRTSMSIAISAIILLTGCAKQGQTNQNASARNESASSAPVTTESQPGAAAGQAPPTPLMAAVLTSNAEEAKRLLDGNVEVDAPNSTGVTPLMNAAGMGNQEIARLLISKGANVNWKTPGNYTVLMSAAINGRTEMVRFLLDAGADPKVKDIAGKTAERYAEEGGHKETAELLRKGR